MLQCSICGAKQDPTIKVEIRRCTASAGHEWVEVQPIAKEAVHHPPHYGGANNPYEAIKVIEAWNLGFCLGNTVKYIARAGKKGTDATLQDLKKAKWYLDHEIEKMEKGEAK